MRCISFIDVSDKCMEFGMVSGASQEVHFGI